MSVSLDLDSVPLFMADMADFVREDLIQIIHEEFEKGIVFAQTISADSKAVGDPQHYVDSFEVDKNRLGAVLYNTAPHANIIEWGARPHYPPMSPLIEWAKVRLGLDDYAARAVATWVRQKIGERGLAPRHIIGQTGDHIEAAIRKRLAKYRRQHKQGKTRAAIRLRQRYGRKSKRKSVEV